MSLKINKNKKKDKFFIFLKQKKSWNSPLKKKSHKQFNRHDSILTPTTVVLFLSFLINSIFYLP